MRSIQDVGLEILNKSPKSLYIFGGEEYGIKQKYIDIVKSCYSEYHEADKLLDVIESMRVKRIVPLQPALYVVRYDEQLLSDISDAVANKIKSAKIIGTIICIYEKSASVTKLDKYLPDNVVNIDKVDPKFLFKYLSNDFKNIDASVVENVVSVCKDYSRCIRICSAISALNPSSGSSEDFSSSNIGFTFGLTTQQNESMFKHAIAARNIRACISYMDNFTGDWNQLYYAIFSTMLELEKIHGNKYAQSDFVSYTNKWSIPSIYNMFMQTYRLLDASRKYTSDNTSSLLYLCSLLAFKEIPEVGSV